MSDAVCNPISLLAVLSEQSREERKTNGKKFSRYLQEDILTMGRRSFVGIRCKILFALLWSIWNRRRKEHDPYWNVVKWDQTDFSAHISCSYLQNTFIQGYVLVLHVLFSISSLLRIFERWQSKNIFLTGFQPCKKKKTFNFPDPTMRGHFFKILFWGRFHHTRTQTTI